MIQQLDRAFGRWPQMLFSLAAIAPCVVLLTLAGALFETTSRALTARRAVCQSTLVAWPRRGSAADLIARLERSPGVAGVVAGLRTAYADDALKEARCQEAWLWAVQSDLKGWEFAPPAPGLRLAAGRLPQDDGEALVGYELARALRLRVGATIWVEGRPFTVVGVWQAGGLAAGNVVQVPYRAASLLFPGTGGELSPIYLVLEPGMVPEAALAGLRPRLDDAVVLAPASLWGDEERLRQMLRLAAAGAALLAALVGGPAAVHTLRPLTGNRLQTAGAAAVVGGLGGAFGLALGWGWAQALNAEALRLYVLTPLAVTPRLGLFVVAWPALAAGLGGGLALRGRAGELGRLWRAAPATGAVAVAVALALLAGGLQESLAVALARTRAGNLGRLGLASGTLQLSESVLGQVTQLPGFRGLLLEAEGGALVEEEDGWPGRPPSGVVYGLISGDGGTGVEVPYPVGLAQGTSLDGPDDVIAGHELAGRLGLRLGDPLTIRGRSFTVVGIREPFAYDALSQVNDRADISLAALRHLLGDPYRFGRLTLLVPPAQDAAQRAAYLERVSGVLRGTRITGMEDELARVAMGFPGGRTLTGEEPMPKVRGLYLRLLLAGMALALLEASLAVCFALYATCLERRKEIALLRLMGAGPGRILAGYLWRALAMGSVGAALGAYSAGLWARAVNALVRGSPVWPPLLITPRLLAATLTLIVVAVTALAMVPGLRAAGVSALAVDKA